MIRTKKQFESFFRAEILPIIREEYEQDGRIDYPGRREAWNNTVDIMAKDGEIPENADWICPW